MKNKGITLISLVVTIVVLIILAGVAINLTLGENGVFRKAKQAKEQYGNAVESEEQQLNELYAQLGVQGELPENTPETDVGTIVKLKDSWATETMRYVSTTDGKDITNVQKVSTVYAVSVGDGNTVPVPTGFYYVGGNLTTGVVISDKEVDKYNGTDRTAYSYSSQLQGNQFVWIPCNESEYKKTSWGQGNVTNRSNSCWDTTTSGMELAQIRKYGGFYVARYEAGLASTITPVTTDTIYNSGVYSVAGVPTSKAGQIPWNFISWTQSQINAQSMYNTNSVSSALITGTQWDVMINKIASAESKSLTSSGAWGNYYDVATTYTGRYATYNTSTTKLNAFSAEESTNATKAANNYVLLTTGASEKVKAYNVYDVAGNLWEWTEETSYYGGNSATQYRVLRGGSCNNASATYPACYRGGNNTVSLTNYTVGFRAVLYMK